ncbi:MAG: undecaprenyl/decaprenyl-phosphate alpha-N-acetylglucosaminyl 1-phosphate transferase [Candidatus Moraniibacteriota bacterium]|nr:MAG: undecaprenyl/decaprenyl-phosphate alpha-N-acetylglucosaminyl 1-phosphate transferase [Candidatus Moranbacteria bacterium]
MLQKKYTRYESGRSQKMSRFFRLGGVALLGGLMIALWFDDRLVTTTSLVVLVGGAGIAVLGGLFDDFRPLHWSWQLLLQLLLGGLLLSVGMNIDRIHLGDGYLIDLSLWPGLSLLGTLVWVLIVMNALNWVDGVDGLMGGVMMVVYFTLFLLSLRPEVNQPTLALLTIMLLGATLAFSLFNWFPATIIAGTSGATFMGFVVAALSLYAGAKVATALLVLSIPILDAGAVIISRFLHGQSPFLPDKKHFHHVLVELGWSSRQIAVFYTLLTGGMALLALATHFLEKLTVFLVVAAVFFGGMILIRRHLQDYHSTPQE